MKHTKENVVTVLRAMSENSIAVANTFSKRRALYKSSINNALGIEQAIQVLTNKDFFDSMVDIFLKEVK